LIATLLSRYDSVTNRNVYNDSIHPLSELQRLILSLGLKFVPRPDFSTDAILQSLLSSAKTFQRRLSLKLFYADTDDVMDQFIPSIPSTWEPSPNDWLGKGGATDYVRLLADHYVNLQNALTELVPTLRLRFDPADALLYKTAVEMGADARFVYNNADKNLGVIRIDRDKYILSCQQHLLNEENYKRVEYPNVDTLYTPLVDILVKHGHYYANGSSGKLSKIATSLLQQKKPKASPFYCVSKVHKKLIDFLGYLIHPGRPLSPQYCTHTYYTSKFLHNKMLLLCIYIQRTVCESTHDFIVLVDRINMDIRNGLRRPFTDKHRFFCADVTSLFPNISIAFGLIAVRAVCERFRVFDKEEIDFLMDLLEWVLRSNYIEFNQEHFLQTDGTSMGTPISVMYAIIVMFYIEDPLTPDMDIYKRFIDDLISIDMEERFTQFLEDFEMQTPVSGIKLDPSSITIGTTGVFLDLNLFFVPYEDGFLLGHSKHTKPTNVKAHLPFQSSHTKTCIEGWVLNEMKRYRMLCTDDATYYHEIELFYKSLTARGYPIEVIHKARNAVPTRDDLISKLRQSVLAKRQPSANNSKPSSKLIHTVCLPQFIQKPELKKLFNECIAELRQTPRYRATLGDKPVIVGTKNTPSVKNLLVRARLK